MIAKTWCAYDVELPRVSTNSEMLRNTIGLVYRWCWMLSLRSYEKTYSMPFPWADFYYNISHRFAALRFKLLMPLGPLSSFIKPLHYVQIR